MLFLNKTYFRDSGFRLPILLTMEAMFVHWYTPCHHLETSSSFRWPLGINETEIYLSFAKLLRFWNSLYLQHDLSFIINEGFFSQLEIMSYGLPCIAFASVLEQGHQKIWNWPLISVMSTVVASTKWLHEVLPEMLRTERLLTDWVLCM